MNQHQTPNINFRFLSYTVVISAILASSSNAFAIGYSGGIRSISKFVNRSPDATVSNFLETASPLLSSGQMCRRIVKNPFAMTSDAKYACALEKDLATDSEKKILIQAWAGTAWPDKMGSIAENYSDRHVHSVISRIWGWKANKGKIVDEDRQATLRTIVKKGQSNIALTEEEKTVLDHSSPAEKYDLIAGDQTFGFSKAVVRMVDFLNEHHRVANWSGVCHGWGPASTALPRPGHSFVVRSNLGIDVPVYPDDIKALTSFLWGKSSIQNQLPIRGNRCDKKNSGLRMRTETGRLDPDGRSVGPCFDPNPAEMHLAVVNQIGLNGRGMLMDIDVGAPVFNQPVFAYSMEFFNPATHSSTKDPQHAIADARDVKEYSHYRSPKAKSIVGVTMTLTYQKEVDPDHEVLDSESRDKVAKMKTQYLLELSDSGEIIGGEWWMYAMPYEQPDFIWLVPDGMIATSDVDESQLSLWNGVGSSPSDWLAAATLADAQVKDDLYPSGGDEGGEMVVIQGVPNPQPLAKIVYSLLRISRKGMPLQGFDVETVYQFDKTGSL